MHGPSQIYSLTVHHSIPHCIPRAHIRLCRLWCAEMPGSTPSKAMVGALCGANGHGNRSGSARARVDGEMEGAEAQAVPTHPPRTVYAACEGVPGRTGLPSDRPHHDYARYHSAAELLPHRIQRPALAPNLRLPDWGRMWSRGCRHLGGRIRPPRRQSQHSPCTQGHLAIFSVCIIHRWRAEILTFATRDGSAAAEEKQFVLSRCKLGGLRPRTSQNCLCGFTHLQNFLAYC